MSENSENREVSSTEEASGRSRRSFIKAASVSAAAVGVVAAVPAMTGVADAKPAPSKKETGAQHAGHFTVFVTDARSGEMTVMAGEGQTVVHDRELAARLARLAAHAGS